MKKLFKIILIILNIPFLLLIILIYPIFKIRINELETRALGHFSITTEIFLSELKRNIHGKKKTIYLWFTNPEIANNYLLSKWKKKIIIGPRIILKPLFKIIQKYSFLKFLKSPFRHWRENDNRKKHWQANDIYNVLPKTKPNIVFDDKEKNYCNNYLEKINTKVDNYICFFSRSGHYRGDATQLRDSDIKNQIKGVLDLCCKNNLKAIRMGSAHQKLKKYNKSIIDYANSKSKNEILDIFLPMNCKFMIGTNSGMNMIPAINRKKTLVVDKADIHAIHAHAETYIPLMIPKKFKKLSNNRLLNFSKVFELKLTEFHYEKDLNKFGYQSVSNSPIEIMDAIFEMNSLVDQKKVRIKDTELQNRFWKIFYKFYKIKRPKVLRICDTFLKRNQKLIN